MGGGGGEGGEEVEVGCGFVVRWGGRSHFGVVWFCEMVLWEIEGVDGGVSESD